MRVKGGLGLEGGRECNRWMRMRVVGESGLTGVVVLMVARFQLLAVPLVVKMELVIEDALYLGKEHRRQAMGEGAALLKTVRSQLLALLLVVKTALVFLDALHLVENCVLVRVSLIGKAA